MAVRYNARTTAEQVAKDHEQLITGRVFLVTGSTSGIGLEVASALAAHGAHVVMCGRSLSTVEPAMAKVRERASPDAQLTPLTCDFASLASVRACAAAFAELKLPLHVLINNAGIAGYPREETKDGIELMWGTNYVGPWLLTKLLLPHLQQTAEQVRAAGGPPNSVRIVNTSSLAQYIYTPSAGIDFDTLVNPPHYNRWERYGISKLCNLLHANELQRRLDASGFSDILAIPLHPGTSPRTGLQRRSDVFTWIQMIMFRRVFTVGITERIKNVPECSSTTLCAAVVPSIQKYTYYSDCQPCTLIHESFSEKAAANLWEFTAKLVAEKCPAEHASSS